MKKTFLFFFLIALFGSGVSAQEVKGNNIVGTWKVLKVNTVTELPKEQIQQMEMLKDAFLKSAFKFEMNEKFSFDFLFEEMAITNAHWKYNTTTNSYIIQEWKDKDGHEKILMEISAKKENGNILFFLPETFISLEVKKE